MAEVKRLAELVRLRLSSKEKKKFAEEIPKIIDYFHSLRDLDLKDIEPLSHIIDIECPKREDKPEKCEEIKLPYKKHRYFAVSKILK